jgi:hypothetical protein
VAAGRRVPWNANAREGEALSLPALRSSPGRGFRSSVAARKSGETAQLEGERTAARRGLKEWRRESILLLSSAGAALDCSVGLSRHHLTGDASA